MWPVGKQDSAEKRRKRTFDVTRCRFHGAGDYINVCLNSKWHEYTQIDPVITRILDYLVQYVLMKQSDR